MKSSSVAVLIATASFAALSAAQDAPASGAVEGTVVNSVTGAGIGGAAVVLAGNKSGRYETTSDIAGRFKITGVAPGSYRPDVKKDGFASPAFDLNSLLNPLNSALRIAVGGDPVKVELKLTPLSTIQGRVFDPDGKPAVGMQVSLYPNIMAELAATDEEGRFALHDIRPASYLLIARTPESARLQKTIGETSDGSRTVLVTTYYPSVADRSLAQQLVLPAPGGGGDYEIRMQTAPVHRVRGIVLDEEGKPVPEAELTMFPNPEGTPEPMGLGSRVGLSLFALGMRQEPSGVPEATTVAGRDGHFDFPAVRSGDWRINVVSESVREARGTVSARVSRSDVDDLQIHVLKPFNLTGTIEWKGEESANQQASDPRPRLGLVTLIDPDGKEFVRTGFTESGELLFENIVPGRYQAIVMPGLSARIFLGEYEVTGQTFAIAPGGPRLRVVLKTWSGTVRGIVEKGEGATVVLVPQRVQGVALGQAVVCGAGGAFELSGVSPGDYYIAAFDHLDDLLSPSAAMVSVVPSRGKSVTVEERSTANVMLPVLAAPR